VLGGVPDVSSLAAVSEPNLGLTKPAEVTLPELTFSAKEIHVTEWKGDILAVGMFEKDVTKDESGVFENPTLKKLDSHVGGVLRDVIKEEDFSGKAGQAAFVRPPGFGFKRVGLIGLGKNGSASLTKSLKGQLRDELKIH
jgi:leucyl aminopeptidase